MWTMRKHATWSKLPVHLIFCLRICIEDQKLKLRVFSPVLNAFQLFYVLWRFIFKTLILFRHIYIPLGGSRHGLWRQIFATFMGFSFIWLWHGAHATIFYWILLNCTTIVIEVVAQRISNIPRVKVLEVGANLFCYLTVSHTHN